MKVQAGGWSAHSGSPSLGGRGATETRRVPLVKWRSLSARHVGTERWLNYARTGRGQRKSWWRFRSGSDVQIRSSDLGSSVAVRLIRTI
ncbi:hypothetical protein JTE90_016520 [Oedothorax gibbosus]|uniref:Uncharacterized protein n=1 Tax=Oedothorax gibbosus TaxID=931172 RepID=A0AAV6TD37_9ARAC|nr:hypothetical protein JTE90_016520 [Oedothorax gibbosus]